LLLALPSIRVAQHKIDHGRERGPQRTSVGMRLLDV
jgi:hypothetical protein